jgi:hypothetical protein
MGRDDLGDPLGTGLSAVGKMMNGFGGGLFALSRS